MNIDTILKFFVPKDHSFFPLFEEDVKNLVKAADLLRSMMTTENPADHERINNEIMDLEHAGDEITTRTYEQLNKSFITPFDREDIHELTATIDDVVDSIKGVSHRLCVYKPKKLLPVYKEMSELIYSAAREIEISVLSLKDAGANKKKITAACQKVKKIEHKADERYFIGVSDLLEKEDNPKELFKNITILEILERCVDDEEDVTDTIKTILIKLA